MVFRRIKSIIRNGLSERRGHIKSRRYWENASTTYLADPAYYQRQEDALRALLSEVASAEDTGLDVGCGDGRFSIVMGDYLKTVLGIDLSEKLIDAAKANVRALEISNVEFEIHNLEYGLPNKKFQIIACMGVTSALIDEHVFNTFLGSIKDGVLEGGFFITKATLSTLGRDHIATTGPYVARYRDVDRYEARIESSGFKLIRSIKLSATESTVNNMYLWKRRE